MRIVPVGLGDVLVLAVAVGPAVAVAEGCVVGAALLADGSTDGVASFEHAVASAARTTVVASRRRVISGSLIATVASSYRDRRGEWGRSCTLRATIP
jgi:hypothetical protein